MLHSALAVPGKKAEITGNPVRAEFFDLPIPFFKFILKISDDGLRDLAIAFNPGYLMDPLKALDDDEVFLELTDELSPGVVKINGPFLYVIMPMRMS